MIGNVHRRSCVAFRTCWLVCSKDLSRKSLATAPSTCCKRGCDPCSITSIYGSSCILIVLIVWVAVVRLKLRLTAPTPRARAGGSPERHADHHFGEPASGRVLDTQGSFTGAITRPPSTHPTSIPICLPNAPIHSPHSQPCCLTHNSSIAITRR